MMLPCLHLALKKAGISARDLISLNCDIPAYVIKFFVTPNPFSAIGKRAVFSRAYTPPDRLSPSVDGIF